MLQFHVLLSLVGMAAGFVVLYGLAVRRASKGWIALFIAATGLTSITGFPLAPFGFDPARAAGVIALLLLALAVAALYAFRLAGVWRWIYIGSAVTALYLNVFVGVVQAFQTFLQQFAPTQLEPPFIVAQLIVQVTFVAFGIAAVRQFGLSANEFASRAFSGDVTEAAHGSLAQHPGRLCHLW
jgi:hypothetical protein